jgi:hypothetical protein
MVQLAPSATMPVQLSANTAKSAGFVPVNAVVVLLIVEAAPELLVTVNVWVAKLPYKVLA